MTKQNVFRSSLFLLSAAALFLLVPSVAKAGCNISCPRGFCMTGEEPAVCCCDFAGNPHCGVFDDYPCGYMLSASPSETSATEGFLEFLAQSEDTTGLTAVPAPSAR